MREIDMDPRGEYMRECPYCKLQFTASHMNRDYCPSKNGKKDWCKNRYKRLVRNGETDDAIILNETAIRMNAKTIFHILNGDKEKIVEAKVLTNINYNFDAYTIKTPRHKINFYSVMVDYYSIEVYYQSEKRTYYRIRNLD
jgi:hypothetical protein